MYNKNKEIMTNLRHFTTAEKVSILESCKLAKQVYNLRYDINIDEDFSVRYTYNNYEYYIAVNFETMQTALIPFNANVCNVIGNLNYTHAFKKEHYTF